MTANTIYLPKSHRDILSILKNNKLISFDEVCQLSNIASPSTVTAILKENIKAKRVRKVRDGRLKLVNTENVFEVKTSHITISKETLIKATAAQLRVVNFIKDFIEEHGFSPTQAEICLGLGFNSTSSVDDHVKALILKKALYRVEQQYRNIRIVEANDLLSEIKDKLLTTTPKDCPVKPEPHKKEKKITLQKVTTTVALKKPIKEIVKSKVIVKSKTIPTTKKGIDKESKLSDKSTNKIVRLMINKISDTATNKRLMKARFSNRIKAEAYEERITKIARTKIAARGGLFSSVSRDIRGQDLILIFKVRDPKNNPNTISNIDHSIGTSLYEQELDEKGVYVLIEAA